MPRSKFGTVLRVGHGVYRIFWTENGRRRSKTIHGERRDADLALGRIQGGLEVVGEPDTVRQFWAKTVWPSCDGLAAKTRDEYERLYWREVDPRIGGRRLRDIAWRDLQHGVVGEIESPSVQRSTARLLSKIFRMAVRERVIFANPCEARFNYDPKRRRPKTLVDTLSVGAFMAAIEGIKYEAVILAMLGGGLRLEEAVVLRWEDIEPWTFRGVTYAVVLVEKTIVSAKGGKLLQDGTKTDQSWREMVIGNPFAARLLALKALHGTGPLVPSGRGGDGAGAEHTSPMTMSHNWRAWCGRRGVEYVRLGDMRTCWSTMHAEAGSPDSIVSLAMGHSDGTTRGSHYLRSTRRALAMIADCLQDAIENVGGDLGIRGG